MEQTGDPEAGTAIASGQRRRIKELECMVADVVAEARSNRSSEDVIFGRELDALQAEHPGRLRIIHTLTRHEGLAPPTGVRTGRVSADLLRDAIPDPSACLVYACGPAISQWDRQAARERGHEPAPRFMESVLALLAELGVPRDRITRESYG